MRTTWAEHPRERARRQHAASAQPEPGDSSAFSTYEENRTRLHIAAGKPDLGEFLALLSKASPEEINHRDLNGDTALHLLARSEYFEDKTAHAAMHDYRRAGGDVTLVNDRGETVLHHVPQGETRSVKQFVDTISNVPGFPKDQKDVDGKTASDRAAEAGDMGRTLALYETGAEPAGQGEAVAFSALALGRDRPFALLNKSGKDWLSGIGEKNLPDLADRMMHDMRKANAAIMLRNAGFMDLDDTCADGRTVGELHRQVVSEISQEKMLRERRIERGVSSRAEERERAETVRSFGPSVMGQEMARICKGLASGERTRDTSRTQRRIKGYDAQMR